MRRGPLRIALGRVEPRTDRRGAHVDGVQDFSASSSACHLVRPAKPQRRGTPVRPSSAPHPAARAPILTMLMNSLPLARNDAASFLSSAISLLVAAGAPILMAVGYESFVDCDMFKSSCGSKILYSPFLCPSAPARRWRALRWRSCSSTCRRRPATRRAEARCVPGRRRHLDQHERQRGARQLALELTGTRRASTSTVEPHDHLNMSQSTNDSYPTAIKVALILRNDKLIAELREAGRILPRQGQRVHRHREDGPHRAAGRGADDGRTGVPRLRGLARGRDRGCCATPRSTSTRSTWAPPRSAPGSTRQGLRREVRRAPGQAHRQADRAGAATCSRPPGTSRASWSIPSALKSVAIKLSKIASDLILLASGPRAGLREINLPAVQPGSSIMPGKVNPVIPELVNLVAFRVMGNDYAVTLAAHSGQLQLNAYEPLEGASHDGVAAPALQRLGMLAHPVRRRHHGEREGARSTTWRPPSASSPRSTRCSATRRPPSSRREAYETGKGILEIIREKNILTEEQIDELLDPEALTGQRTLTAAEEPNRIREEIVIAETGTLLYARTLCCLILHADSQLLASAARRCRTDSAARAERPTANVVILATGGTIAGAAATGTSGRLHQRRGRHRHD